MDIDLTIDEIAEAFETGENLCDYIPDDELKKIGMEVKRGYQEDLDSRSEWEERNEQALKLALQITEDKSFPWPNASNVKFPLITIAALQFSARAYPALVQTPHPVKCRVIGQDPDGQKTGRARRVSSHMSYQLMEQDEDWEEETDKSLITLPIIGCTFKKSYFDPSKGMNASEHVLAKDLVVNYWTKSLEDSPRYTHYMEKSSNSLEEKMREGLYRRIDLTNSEPEQNRLDKLQDERQGLHRGYNDAFHGLLEQYTYLDLDDDGYKEPYTVLVHEGTGEPLRITPRFSSEDVIVREPEREVVKITPHVFFTKYSFIPSPDGGFYDLGFGALLGPINESVNTAINQLIDAGTRANLQGGFIGRGARMKKGEYVFKPGEWKTVNATGDDLRKSIFPLPIKEPSTTLFNLLSLLIEYGERISSVTDLMTGQTPGQNTPATTSMAALEQGMKVFTGIYKRVFRSLRKEFRVLYNLNRIYLNPEEVFTVIDENIPMTVYQADYRGDPTDIAPNADPNIASEGQRMMLAEAVKAASQTSGFYNTFEVEKRYLEALNVPGIGQLLPEDEQGNPAIQPPPDPEIEIKKQEAQTERMKVTNEALETEARIKEIMSKAYLNIAKAEAEEEKVDIEQYKAIVDEIGQLANLAKAVREDGQDGVRSVEGQSGNSESN